MTLKDALNWRRATKQFDTTKKLSETQVKDLLETTLLSVSSFGLQPWKIVNASTDEVRAALLEAGYQQPQFGTSSNIIVFAVNKNLDAAYVDHYIQHIKDVRQVGDDDEKQLASLETFSETMKGAIAGRTPEQLVEWSSRQVYIALGTLIAAASLEGIDCSPMEGFNGEQFDQILGLADENCHALACVALGYRSEDDGYSKMAKVRFPYDEIIRNK